MTNTNEEIIWASETNTWNPKPMNRGIKDFIRSITPSLSHKYILTYTDITTKYA